MEKGPLLPPKSYTGVQEDVVRDASPQSSSGVSSRDAVSAKNARKREEHSTNDFDTLVHLVKCNIGTGLLALPSAVKNAGYIVGPLGILLLGFIATHCMVLLLETSAALRKKYQVVALDYSETMQFAWLDIGRPKTAKVMKTVVNGFLILTQFGFCSVYIVFIAVNLQQVIQEAYHLEWSQQVWIAFLILPLVLFSWIRNLDHLSPLSFVANVCLLVGILVILYDEVDHLVTHRAAIFMSNATATHHKSPHVLYPAQFDLSLALFFGSVAFTYEAIGIVLPLENKMRHPDHAKPVVYFGMVLITVMYAVFGLVGYLVYGSDVQSTVTLNLCSSSIPIKVVFLVTKLVFALDIFATYLLQFYVPLDFLEPFVLKCLFLKRPTAQSLALTVFRTVIVLGTVTIALTVPDLGDLLSLVGALASSMLAFVFPPLLEMITFWNSRASKRWLLVLPWLFWFVKDILIIVLGLVGFAFGTFANMYSIVEFYKNNSTSPYNCSTITTVM